MVTDKDNLVAVTFPWNNNVSAFSGIPPHVSLMQQIQGINERTQGMVVEFVQKMMDALESMGVDGGRMNEHHLRNILQEFQGNLLHDINTRLSPNILNNAGHNGNNDVNDIKQSHHLFQPHSYLGKWHRVPFDWRFPRCGVFDLWRMW